MSNDNVVNLIQPGTLTDQLTDVLRNGARVLLIQALEAEVSEFLAGTADLKTQDGCRRVVRHGHLCENASNHDPTAKLTQRIDFVRKNEISAGSFSRET